MSCSKGALASVSPNTIAGPPAAFSVRLRSMTLTTFV